MNPARFYQCPNCAKRHANPAKAAICCLKANERWFCTTCQVAYKTEEKAGLCCRLDAMLKNEKNSFDRPAREVA